MRKRFIRNDKEVLLLEDDPNVCCLFPTRNQRNGVAGEAMQNHMQRMIPKVIDDELPPGNTLIIASNVKKSSTKGKKASTVIRDYMIINLGDNDTRDSS